MTYNFIVLIASSSTYNNKFGVGCNNITLKGGSSGNIFEENCNKNLLTGTSGSNYNTFGYGCKENTLDGASSNTFASGCYSNTLTGCNYNSFGKVCYSNSLSSGANYNVFGPSCYNNTLGIFNTYNIFEAYSYNNTLGGYNCRITFEQGCNNNKITASSVYDITFKNAAYSNTIVVAVTKCVLDGANSVTIGGGTGAMLHIYRVSNLDLSSASFTSLATLITIVQNTSGGYTANYYADGKLVSYKTTNSGTSWTSL